MPTPPPPSSPNNPPLGAGRASRLPAAARKSQLLDTAARLFALRGYSGTTTAELAKAAGITEPIIYRHFKGKREMFIALVERTGQETIREWEEALKDGADEGERLARLLTTNPMVMSKGRVTYRVIVQAMMEVEDEGIRAAVAQHFQTLHAFVMNEVRAAQATGLVSKRFTPEITAWALIQLGLGYGVLNSLRVPGQGTDRAGTHVADVIGQLMLGDRYRRPGE